MARKAHKQWRVESKKWVRQEFPDIPGDHFTVTSEEDSLYNCVSHAAEDKKRWWWPIIGRYWPNGVPRVVTMEAFIAAFATLGYEPCDFDLSVEMGFEKVVIYGSGVDGPKHMARQLGSGFWTSKLGQGCDIAHHALGDIEGVKYGRAVQMLRRPRKPLSLAKRKGRTKRLW